MIAVEEARRTQELIEDRDAQPAPDPELELADVPKLVPTTKPFSALKMNNQRASILFETIAKLAGLNVMFDASVRLNVQHYDVDLASEPLEQALDQISMLTKCFWKPISDKTFFVAADNPQTRRDYEEGVGEAFYLKNITTAQELQEISNIVRKLRDLLRLL